MQLHALDVRYARRVRSAIERKIDPYSHEVPCRGLQTALPPLEFNRGAWTVLYEALERSVAGYSHAFYRQVNSALAEC